METPQPFVGIDVSSQRLDVDSLPASHHFSEPNTEDGIASLVLRLRKLTPRPSLLHHTPAVQEWGPRFPRAVESLFRSAAEFWKILFQPGIGHPFSARREVGRGGVLKRHRAFKPAKK